MHIFQYLNTLFFVLVFATQSHAQNPMRFDELASGVYFYEADFVEFFDSDNGFVANITFIVGDDAIAVIDTGASLRQGQLLRAEIARVSDLPVKYVINTHSHLDHIFGNKAFIADQPEFIAHVQYQHELAAKGEYFLSRLDTPWFEGTELIAANRLINEDTVIDLGNRKLRIQINPRAHTNNDLSVLDHQSGTLITGDLVFVEHCPSLEGNIRHWVQVLAGYEENPPPLLLPGHGPAQRDMKAVKKLRLYLQALSEQVSAAIEKGIDINTASKTILLSERDQWVLFDDFHTRNILQAYQQLEWE